MRPILTIHMSPYEYKGNRLAHATHTHMHTHKHTHTHIHMQAYFQVDGPCRLWILPEIPSSASKSPSTVCCRPTIPSRGHCLTESRDFLGTQVSCVRTQESSRIWPQEYEYNARNDTQAQSEEAGHQGRQGRAQRQQAKAERQQVEAERQQVARLHTSRASRASRSTTKDTSVKSVMCQPSIYRASSPSDRPSFISMS